MTDTAVAKPVPVRRVGSWTLGMVLIACGASMLAYYFWPAFDYLLAAKLSPLVLVALGAEVLICAARPEKRKYDFISIFVCLALMACALCVTAVPLLWAYLGPERSWSEQSLRGQLEQQLYTRLKTSDVERLDLHLGLTGAQMGPVTLNELDGTEIIWVNAELTGPYSDPAVFAAACRTVADAVQAMPVQVDELTVFCNREYSTTGGVAGHIELVLDSPYTLNWSAEQMAAQTRQTYYSETGAEITRQEWLAQSAAALTEQPAE